MIAKSPRSCPKSSSSLAFPKYFKSLKLTPPLHPSFSYLMSVFSKLSPFLGLLHLLLSPACHWTHSS